MAGQEPELGVDLIECRLDQAEAIDGGAMDGVEVGVVGLVAGIGREAELLGGQRMDDAGLEAGGDDGALDRQMVVAGALDGDDEVARGRWSAMARRMRAVTSSSPGRVCSTAVGGMRMLP